MASLANATFLRRTGSLGAGNQYPFAASDPVTVAFYTQLSGANTTNRRFYQEETEADPEVFRLEVKYLAGSGGRLAVVVNYNDGSARTNQYFYNNFENFFKVLEKWQRELG